MLEPKSFGVAFLIALLSLVGCNRPNGPADGTKSLAKSERLVVCRFDYKAAGILPYTIRNGRVLVLLGEETRPEGTVWTDFIGTRVDTDCAPVTTAAREFEEESRESYPRNETTELIRTIEPIVIDPPGVHFWILQVSDIPATEIEKRSFGLYSEKAHYCWLDLKLLLDSIDTDTRRIPHSCGGHSHDLFALFEKNLEKGGIARPQLDAILKHSTAALTDSNGTVRQHFARAGGQTAKTLAESPSRDGS